MCGLVAAFNRLSNGYSKKAEDTFFDMLYADSLRGEDSTGIIAVHNDGSFGIAKTASSSVYCIPQLQEVDHIKQMFSRGRVYIGHNRKATVGKISDENAHPFVVDGKFAMVHNGTLYSHKHLADTEIDSEALTIHLSKVLNKDYERSKFEEEIGKVSGAYAVIAYDQESNKVFFTRNDQRPLHIVYHDEGFILSSEVGLALWCMNRNSFGGNQIKTEPVKVNVLYTVDLDTLQITEEEYVPKKATPVTPATSTGRTLRTQVNTGVEKTFNSGVSKSQLKRLKRKFLGKYVSFFVDDWVEKFFPKTVDDGETVLMVFGESDDLPFTHSVTGEFDIAGLNTDAWRITERAFRGQIIDIERNDYSQCLTVHMHDIVMYNAPHIDVKALSRKLEREDEEDLKNLCVKPHEEKTNLH